MSASHCSKAKEQASEPRRHVLVMLIMRSSLRNCIHHQEKTGNHTGRFVRTGPVCNISKIDHSRPDFPCSGQVCKHRFGGTAVSGGTARCQASSGLGEPMNQVVLPIQDSAETAMNQLLPSFSAQWVVQVTGGALYALQKRDANPGAST